MPDIAAELGVSRSSVSLWTRDVPFDPRPRRSGVPRQPNVLQRAKAEEIATAQQAGRTAIGQLTRRDLLVAGVALYAGEGTKTSGAVTLVNSDPRIIALHLRWLRTCFAIRSMRRACGSASTSTRGSTSIGRLRTGPQ